MRELRRKLQVPVLCLLVGVLVSGYRCGPVLRLEGYQQAGQPKGGTGRLQKSVFRMCHYSDAIGASPLRLERGGNKSIEDVLRGF